MPWLINQSTRNRLHLLLQLFTIGLLSLLALPVNAQTPTAPPPWQGPVRLSSTENNVKFGTNAIVSDSYGYTHAFWIETGETTPYVLLQYARFDGEDWSPALDIYASRSEPAHLSPTIDAEGNLYLAWSESNNGPIYTMQAAAHDALSARKWTTPQVLKVPGYEVVLRVDHEGTFHLLYTHFYAGNPGVYYTRSKNGGASWSTPQWLDRGIVPPNAPPAYLRFEIGNAAQLHAVWAYINASTSGSTRWIVYSHSLDGGNSWNIPTEMVAEDRDETGALSIAQPALAVDEAQVQILWFGGFDNKRTQRFSLDSGQTWSVPRHRTLGGFDGQAGQDALFFDQQGTLHYLLQIRFPKALYHFMMPPENMTWRAPETVYFIASDAVEEARVMNERLEVHDVQASIDAHNNLLTIFTDSPSIPNTGLFAMHRPLTTLPAPSRLPTPPLIALATSSEQAESVKNTATPVPERTTTMVSPATPLPPSSVDAAVYEESPLGSAMLSSGLVLILVLTVFTVRQIRSR